jgi:hypothetical protein
VRRDQLRDDTFLNGSHEVSALRGDLAQPQRRGIRGAIHLCEHVDRNRTKLRARLINEVLNGGKSVSTSCPPNAAH